MHEIFETSITGRRSVIATAPDLAAAMARVEAMGCAFMEVDADYPDCADAFMNDGRVLAIQPEGFAVTFPRLVTQTARASYWEVADGIYQATKGEEPSNQAGYHSLLAIMLQKGESWETRLPFMEKLRRNEKP